MRDIPDIYIDGAFVAPHGQERFDLHNPATGQLIGRVTLADAVDAERAVAAAKRAFETFRHTTKAERIALLHRLYEAVQARLDDITAATVEEYGGAVTQARWRTALAPQSFLDAAEVLEHFELTRRIGTAEVVMEPLGVVALITPWNSNAGFICSKLAYALAAGCTAVLKPSEMSALETQVVTEALHAAGLPPGVFNIVTGRGEVVGAALTAHPDVAKVSFTGSTAVGKAIVRASADTLKRVTLELGGKSPTVVLDDADLGQAAFQAIRAGIGNNGQACIAGSRILVPAAREAEFLQAATAIMGMVRTGDPAAEDTQVGPLVSEAQWNRVQRYIALGIEEGATLAAGGPGKPEGLEAGWFVKPTLFADVRNDMTIAREEIFGPVLCVIPYADEDEAVRIANDTPYGLQAMVLSADPARARRVADRLLAGRVLINEAQHQPLAPFGGFKQSGLGREYGVFGLEAYLEPKAVLS